MNPSLPLWLGEPTIVISIWKRKPQKDCGMDRSDDWLQRISEGEISGALKNEIAGKSNANAEIPDNSHG